MHPAKSVIFFTTATGAGYGLMFWLALITFHGHLPADPVLGWISFVTGFGLIVGGLLSSTFHLGHPERAWRAFSQWRSSWLSREGVMAMLTFIPLGLFAIYWLFLGQNGGIAAIFGVIGAVMSLITVFTTAMIYASLKTIPAWHNIWTKIGYLVLCLMSGALLTLIILTLTGHAQEAVNLAYGVLILLILGLLIKILYWMHIQGSKPVSTAESATGLGQFGKVAFAGSPHSADNYLLKEMGFGIARKHADKLRLFAVLFGFFLPFVLVALSHMEHLPAAPALIIAGLSCGLGLVLERWLFFAEAKHVVTLYYGESQV